MTQRRKKVKKKKTETAVPVRGKKKQASSKKQSQKRGRNRPAEMQKKAGRKRPVTHNKKKRKKSGKPRKRVKRKKQPLKVILLEVGISLLIFVAVMFVLSQVTFTTIKVEGYSMTEQLTDGDRVFVNRLNQPKQFDLVAFKDAKGDVLVRRVIGLPGARLYYKDDQLYINEEQKVERYLESAVALAKQGGMKTTEDFTLSQLTGQSQVPKDKYFVLGDNRQYATDSRYFGFVSKKDIIGTVEFRFFPFHTLTGF